MAAFDLDPTLQRLSDGRKTVGVDYSGRVLLIGLGAEGTDLEGKVMQGYALTGRSDGSRKRIFVQDGETNMIKTTAPGMTPEEMAATPDADLIYYAALQSRHGVHVVSNGAQTPHVLKDVVRGHKLEEAVRNAPIVEGQKGPIDLSMYEPDPSSTPRITGVLDLREDAPTPAGLTVVRKELDGEAPIYSTYEVSSLRDLTPGILYGIQTYNHNSETPEAPIPSFDQDPFLFSSEYDLMTTAHALWDALDYENRVAVVMQATDIASGQPAGTVIQNSRA